MPCIAFKRTFSRVLKEPTPGEPPLSEMDEFLDPLPCFCVQIFVLTFWKSQCFEMMRWVEARLPGVLHFGRGTWLVGTWLVGNLTSWDVLTLLDRTGPSPIHHCWLCTSWHVPLTAEFYIKLTREVLNGACQQSFGSYYILLVPRGSGVGQSEKDNLEADTIPQAWRRCRKRFGLYQTHDNLQTFYNFTTCNRAPHPKGGERLLGENSLLAI